jgi:hypothetical protein
MGTAAVVMIRKEHEVAAEFERHRATSQATAQSLAILGLRDDLALGRLRRRAVVREAVPGLFYLDEASWAAMQQSRRRLISIVLTILVIVAAALWMSQGRGG